ncbi:hypothetical protein FRC10_005611, partial [Ceratobasidium sp. 414]
PKVTTHKRQRSSLDTVAGNVILSEPDTREKKKARAHGNREDKEPNLTFEDITRRMRLRLDNDFHKREVETAHLWYIHELIISFANELTRDLHRGTWWYFQDLCAALGAKDSPAFDVFLAVTGHKGSVHDFGRVLANGISTLQKGIATSKQRIGQREKR